MSFELSRLLMLQTTVKGSELVNESFSKWHSAFTTPFDIKEQNPQPFLTKISA